MEVKSKYSLPVICAGTCSRQGTGVQGLKKIKRKEVN